MTTRGHRHNGHEQFLILEGELIEDDGRVLKTIQKIFFQNLAIAYEQDLPVFSRDSL